MLGKLEIILENADNVRLSCNISSLFQGVLMELVDAEYADTLHKNGLKPYSQYIELKKNRIKWTIHTLTEEAKNHIINPILNNAQNITLKHKNLTLNILEKKVKITTYEQLLNERYFSDGKRYININFITPTAFKSQGDYVFHPNIRLILQNLMNKFDSASLDSSIYSEEVLGHLTNNSNIAKYLLKSTIFHMEGVKIPSFIGQVTIRINGPQAMVNLANLLLYYGEYSGVGIKSALGMGGMRIRENTGRD